VRLLVDGRMLRMMYTEVAWKRGRIRYSENRKQGEKKPML
jgi:hypothetical protein